VEALLQNLHLAERILVMARWGKGAVVETVDHGDELNPKDPAYARVVLGKWHIHLARDREGDVLVVMLIGNHRTLVETYEVKMKGMWALSQWIHEKFMESAAEVGHVDFDADGDFLAHGGAILWVGFVTEETRGIVKPTLQKRGPGGFVSYSCLLLAPEGPWCRHRQMMLKESDESNESSKSICGKWKQKHDQADDDDQWQSPASMCHCANCNWKQCGSAAGCALCPLGTTRCHAGANEHIERYHHQPRDHHRSAQQ